MDCTYIMGFWHIPENRKHDIAHYVRFIPKSLAMLRNKKIVFFYESDDILTFVMKHVQTPHFLPIKLAATDLPTYALSADLLESCKKQDNALLKAHGDQKGLMHYRLEYLRSGEASYRKVISIWTSKVPLVDRICQENPFGTEVFTWVDASLSRIGMPSIDVICDLNRINTNPSAVLYMGEVINANASFMYATRAIWRVFVPLYLQKLQDIKDSNYAHDEETIMHLIYKDQPQLFAHVRHPH